MTKYKRLQPGDIYGKLTLIKRIGTNKRKNTVWEALCECGTTVTRDSGTLSRSAGSSSCGCNRELTLSGRYGNLQAVEPLHLLPNIGRVWRFVCDCGEFTEKVGSHVSRGGTALHCGCKKRIPKNKSNLTDKRFGMLLVKKRSGTNKSGRATWECVCDCGRSVTIDGMYLKRGSRTHCGCVKITRLSTVGHGQITKDKWRRITNGAKTRGIEFRLTIEDAWRIYEKQKGKCNLSGIPISFDEKTASLDRICSTLPYIPDNVQWVHKKINVMKWAIPQEEFIQICRKVSEHNTRHPN